jgi:hypothetical protein
MATAKVSRIASHRLPKTISSMKRDLFHDGPKA